MSTFILLCVGMFSCFIGKSSSAPDLQFDMDHMMGHAGNVASKALDELKVVATTTEGKAAAPNSQLDMKQLNEHIADVAENILGRIRVSETTEVYKIEADGCNKGLLNRLELMCLDVHEVILRENSGIPDKSVVREIACCSVEDYEKCKIRAYDRTNCNGRKESLKEDFAVNRLQLTVAYNITCTDFSGNCENYLSSQSRVEVSMLVISLLVILAMFIIRF